MSEQRMAYDEVHGSRTTQQAADPPQRERIAYEELQSGDVIQPGDEWQHESGRWKPFASLDGSCVQVRHTQRARRPHKVSVILEIGDALANTQKAAMQLQDERNEFQTALIESRLALKRKVAEVMEVCKERDEACRERDLARAEVARLSTELWARKPLEDRVASLVDELAQARAEIQQLLKTITDNADQFADAGRILEQQRDEARAEVRRLQEVVSNLYSEPTARQVQDMLRTWATELDWSAGCLDSVGREQIDTIQKTLIAVIERVETMIQPEGGTDGE